MQRLLLVASGVALSVALGACKPEMKYDAPPQAALPAAGWQPLTADESGAAAAGREHTAGMAFLDQDDLDGDGKADRVILVGHKAAGLYAVEVQLANGARERLMSGPLEAAGSKVLRRIGKGHYTRNCGYFNADKGGGEVRCGPLYTEQVVLEQRAASLFDIRTQDSIFIMAENGKPHALVMDGATEGAKRPGPR